jgi:uncharacterized protein with HEPN domain
MPPRTRAALFDVAHAALGISEFVENKTLDDYRDDLMLRSAVERQFTVIGEAMSRIRKSDPETAAKISEYDRIISFRNILVHHYDKVDDTTTWKSSMKSFQSSSRKCSRC